MRRQGISLGSTAWLPEWLMDARELDGIHAGKDARIALAIDLARRNVEHATGGPFGAIVFDEDDRVVAAGVNRVEPLQVSLAYAEIMARMGAQRSLGRARLNGDGRRYTPTCSAQPCCQCDGAIVWAGIDELLIGARGEDSNRSRASTRVRFPTTGSAASPVAAFASIATCTATRPAPCSSRMQREAACATEPHQ